MSEEVVIADEVQAGVFFVLSLDSMVALLSKEAARGLRDDLNKFIGDDKSANVLWKVGDLIPRGSEEPDLPIGSKIKDDSEYGDIAVRTDGGWKWVTVLGGVNDERCPWKWNLFANDFTFTVVKIGSGA